MDIQYVRKLVKIVTDSQIAELEIEEEGQRVRVTRTLYTEPVVMASPASAAHAVAPQPQAAAPAAVEESAPAPEPAGGVEVRSPIVGTFYRASSPDAEPFVKVGEAISTGQTLCIIEAMKIMNEIESDQSGTIVKILVEDGQPVEYNQPLFIVNPS
ncbi:MAG: acetyl-CoA carboxylase biotin carboxyl carrier protein [Ignavibacteria bacterium]|nr:MAG: acetyl-CoA carboxylase biotin carboxyl carrier protein [Ignavibacteria bacterium]